MKATKSLFIAVLGFGLFLAQSTFAVEFVKDVGSIQKQNCSVKLKNEFGTINYENVGTSIATFSHTWTDTIPVDQRIKVQKYQNNTNIIFSKTAYQKTVGNVYSICISLVMAKGLFMTPVEADSLLLKTSQKSWLDICVKNSDGFSDKEVRSEIEARSEFIFVPRDITDGRLSLNNQGSASIGLVINSGKISGKVSGIQYEISCELENVEKE